MFFLGKFLAKNLSHFDDNIDLSIVILIKKKYLFMFLKTTKFKLFNALIKVFGSGSSSSIWQIQSF
jgi:hypothetical protein